ncbi:MAG: TIGR02281 family clan AA aspartic protease, partial [Methylophilaceae bacterium]
MKLWFLVLVIVSLTLSLAVAEDNLQVNVVALFTGKAVVIVNKGKPQTLAVGQKSIEGIKLISAN